MNESLMLAEYISGTRYVDLDENTVTAAKKSFLDGIGVTLAAGTLGEGCREFVELALATSSNKEASIIGFNAKTSTYMAAFANGSMAHALDFEDTHDEARVHPNAATIPAALAVAESIGNISGKDFITALALGSDVVCRLGLVLMQNDPIRYGWYMPPILGAFGATVAACKLMKLTPEQILNAFSLTLCQATCSAELTFNPDSVVRAIRDAFSAKAGVISAQLASRNITGFEHPLEGKAGLFRLYGRESFDLEPLTEGLGKVFEGTNVSFKPWPCCRGTHPFCEAVLRGVIDDAISLNIINEIIVRFSPDPLTTALFEPIETKQAPKRAIDAKFSIPFTMAIAIAEGNIALKHFSPDALKNPKVLSIARKINYRTDNNIPPGHGLMQLKTTEEIFEYRTPEFVYGHPNNPMNVDSLIRKFKDCGSYASNSIKSEKLDKFKDLVLRLEKVSNINECIQQLIA